MTNEEKYQVAATIIAQLGGCGQLRAMLGAKLFVVDENSVSFRFKGSRKVNSCRVIYDPGADLYRLELYKIYKADCLKRASWDGLDVAQLRRAFEGETGLYLSLGTMGT